MKRHTPAGSSRNKVVAHVDLDAFYTQVEAKRNPSIRGKPLVVIQYNPFGDLRTLRPEDSRIFPNSNGSIIAVSYEARAHGVKRNIMAQQAKAVCPELVIVQVPVAHGKADLTIYREAGAEVMSILSSQSICERASIDEAYLDITEASARRVAAAAAAARGLPDPGHDLSGWHLAGQEEAGALATWWQRPVEAWAQDEKLLAAGAEVVAELREAVKQKLGYSCSAGIAHYKVMAKLASGLHKPSQQTLVPAAAVPHLLGPLPIPKLRQLGGKFGEQLMSSFGISTVGELAAVPLPRLEAAVGEETAAWLSKLARGQDEEEVKQRMLAKSCSCGKTFRGAKALRSVKEVEHWLLQLGQELEERLAAERQANQRLPQLLTISLDAAVQQQQGQQGGEGSRQLQQLHGQHRVKRQRLHEQQVLDEDDTADDEDLLSLMNQQRQQQQQQGEDESGGMVLGGLSEGRAKQEAAPGSGNAADGVGTSGRNPAGSSGGVNGRATAANWRAGVQNSSRSCPLGRPTAKSMASAALGMVRKWASDRATGWRIVGMFLSATNFTEAPTGASTLERFLQPKPQQSGAVMQENGQADVDQQPRQGQLKQQEQDGEQQQPQPAKPDMLQHGQQQQQQQTQARAAGTGAEPRSKRMKFSKGQAPMQMFLQNPAKPEETVQQKEEQQQKGQLQDAPARTGQHACRIESTSGDDDQKQPWGPWADHERQQEQEAHRDQQTEGKEQRQQQCGAQLEAPVWHMQQHLQAPRSVLSGLEEDGHNPYSLPGQLASLHAWLPDTADDQAAACAAAAPHAAGAAHGAGDRQAVGSSSMHRSDANTYLTPSCDGGAGQAAAARSTNLVVAGGGGGTAAGAAQGLAGGAGAGAAASGNGGEVVGDSAAATWIALTVADIDPAVLSELPFHVQQEVMQAVRERDHRGGRRGGRSAGGGAGRQASKKGSRQMGRASSERRDSSATMGSISRFFQNSI